MIDKNIAKYALVLILAVLSLSTSALFIKLSSAPAAVTAFYRLFFAACVLAPFVLSSGLSELRRMSGRDLLQTTAAGVFLGLHFVLWFESLRFTSVASSVFFVTLSPVFSYLGGYFVFGSRLSRRSIAAGLIALSGGLLIAVGDLRLSGSALWGDLLALAGAAAAAVYWLFGQQVRKQVSLLGYTFVLYGAGAVALLLYAAAIRVPLAPYPTSDWLIFAGLALIPTLLGHSLFNWLLRWLDATVVSVSILAESVVASALAYLLFGEKVSAFQWGGGMLILAGVYGYVRFRTQEKGESSA